MDSLDTFGAFADQLFEPLVLVDAETGAAIYANAAAREFFDVDASPPPSFFLDVVIDATFRFEEVQAAIGHRGAWQGDDLAIVGRNKQKIGCRLNATHLALGGDTYISFTVQNSTTNDLAALGEDVRKIAHDIRGALASAQLMCDRFAEHDDQMVRRSSELLARSLNRVFQMCVQILQVGRAKVVDPQPVQFYLSDLISDLAASMAGRTYHSVVTLADNKDVLIEADYDQMYRVLLNLSRNAKNAGASHIKIGGAITDTGAEITVADDGPGIPEDTIPSLFKKKALYSGAGTGLGLIITHEIVTSHKGRIELVKNDDEGAMFSIYLPRDGADQDLEPGAQADLVN